MRDGCDPRSRVDGGGGVEVRRGGGDERRAQVGGTEGGQQKGRAADPPCCPLSSVLCPVSRTRCWGTGGGGVGRFDRTQDTQGKGCGREQSRRPVSVHTARNLKR